MLDIILKTTSFGDLFRDLTCVEVFRALNEGDYVYDSVEEHLRRIMSDEKRNAVLPVRTYDDIVHVSSNT
ncbi:hypothetical protein Q1695_004677 [Nippostrongylus brasiliensis]|nr:hypothetical protein Q1695_004677 [Nippostrongylus brasiliensis]